MILSWFRGLSDNGRVVAQTTAVVIGMGSLGWASVPLYDLFCRVTGYGGTTAISDGSNIEVLDRTINVRFDASKAAGPQPLYPKTRNNRKVATTDIKAKENGLSLFFCSI